MADYTFTFARSARRELENLSADVANRILGKIQSLACGPRPPGVVKLQGQKNLWRIRVGNYRVVYSINDAARIIDVYRDF